MWYIKHLPQILKKIQSKVPEILSEKECMSLLCKIKDLSLDPRANTKSLIDMVICMAVPKHYKGAKAEDHSTLQATVQGKVQ